MKSNESTMEESAWSPRHDPVHAPLRASLLWQYADLVLTRRAAARLGLAAFWVVLTASVVGWNVAAWGLPTVVGTGLSLLHSRRRLVNRIGAILRRRWPRIASMWLWALPYPSRAHVNLIGFIEIPSLLPMALVTGWFGRLGADTDVRAIASAVVLLILLTMVHNMVGHPVWELDPPRRAYRTVRPLIGPLFFGVAVICLLPGAASETARLTVLLGAVFGILASWWHAHDLTSMTDMFDRAIRSTRTRSWTTAAGVLHSAAKNPASLLLAELDGVEQTQVRDRVRHLYHAISSLERQFARQAPWSARSAMEIVDGLVAAYTDLPAPAIDVVADVDPLRLTPADAELTFIAISDLVTNAVAADAVRVEVSLRASSADYGSDLEVQVTCSCGEEPPDPEPGSSLWRLAEMVLWREGTFTLDGGADEHTFTVRWPTRAVFAPTQSTIDG